MLGLVLLPSFLSPKEQRDLVRWSLQEHSHTPNETNLDIHYVLPAEGLWNKSVQDGTALVYPRPIEGDTLYLKSESGPRQLINNTPANMNNFESMNHASKPPPLPSATEPFTCSDLLPRLRWANIGWFYHWGTKQYDFTKGKIPVHDAIRTVCKGAVRSIEWKDVFASDTSDWGPDGPDWMDWHEKYGTCSRILFHVKG